MNQKVRCANSACRRLFSPNPHVKNHRYCSRKECQRVRKSLWQRQKMKDDPDYRDNHRDAQRCWMEHNRDYWQRYREQHPEYVKRNRILQIQRDRRRCIRDLAKMDASDGISFVKPGSYYLIPAKGNLAKMDASPQRYFLIPGTYPDLAKKDTVDFPSSLP